MANNSRGRCRHPQPQQPQPSPVPAFTEPEMRRWPHPVDSTASPTADRSAPQNTEAALQQIRCALVCQNQLLAEIKVLLEQLAADAAQAAEDRRTEQKKSAEM